MLNATTASSPTDARRSLRPCGCCRAPTICNLPGNLGARSAGRCHVSYRHLVVCTYTRPRGISWPVLRQQSQVPRLGYLLCGIFVGLPLLACANQFDRELLDQAASQLDCPREQVVVADQDVKPTVQPRRYRANGCGRETEVEARCSVLGACAAYQPGHADEAFPSGPASSTEFPGPPQGPQP